MMNLEPVDVSKVLCFIQWALEGRGGAIAPNVGKNNLLFEDNRNKHCFLTETIAWPPNIWQCPPPVLLGNIFPSLRTLPFSEFHRIGITNQTKSC